MHYIPGNYVHTFFVLKDIHTYINIVIYKTFKGSTSRQRYIKMKYNQMDINRRKLSTSKAQLDVKFLSHPALG